MRPGVTQRSTVPFVRRLGQALLDSSFWLLATAVSYFTFRHHEATSITLADRVVTIDTVIAVHLTVALAFGLYQGRFWYGSSREMTRVFATAATAAAAGCLAALATGQRRVGVEAVVFACPMMLTFAQSARLVHYRRQRRVAGPRNPTGRRLLVFGAGDGAEMAVRSLVRSATTPFVPVAMLDDDPGRQRLEIERVKVMGTRQDIGRVASATDADAMLIAIPSANSDTLLELTELGRAAGLEVFVLPSVEDLFGSVAPDDIRPVTEIDLLGRHPVDIDIDKIATFLTGRRVLVTGAGGSIGSELCRQIERFAPESLYMLDCDDSGLHGVELSIKGRALLQDQRLVLADIRDRQRIIDLFCELKPEVVFHAAALKHLSLLEHHPSEGWKTNVLGTQNVLDAAMCSGVTNFVNISTDKAADPTSVLGWSKRITERQTAYAAARCGRAYVSVRFGNVIGSRGSVLEIFEAQLRAGGPLTVTDENVTRYFMTVAEAVRLTLNAAAVGAPGEALVLDMGKPVRIADVARRLVATSPRPVEIVFTGLRDGEKLHETLLSADEAVRRPSHPKVSHVDVPPLDLRSVSDLPDGEITAADLARIASIPASQQIRRN